MKHDLGNLTFLLTIGAMPLACAAEDPGETSDTAPSTTSPSTTDPGTGTEEGSTASTVSSTDPDSGGTGDVPAACQAYAEHYIECFPGYDGTMAAQYCASYLGYGEEYGAGCIAAIEEVYACLAMVDCAAWESERTPICEAEYAAVTSACPWEEDTTGGSGSDSGSETSGSSSDGGSDSSSSTG